MTRPVIAVPHLRAPTAERTRYYYESLAGAGAAYVVIEASQMPREAHGLLLTGGTDVGPALYGERRARATDRPNRSRDSHEMGLLRQALERDIPVLAICRGHQLLNVALGGSLLQDIDGDAHSWLEDKSSSWHEVTLAPEGRLAAVYGACARLRVNSRHHQGITLEGLAPALAAAARSPDGLVEAVESREQRWVIGLQWHPERPEMRPQAGSLFRAFVEACAK